MKTSTFYNRGQRLGNQPASTFQPYRTPNKNPLIQTQVVAQSNSSAKAQPNPVYSRPHHGADRVFDIKNYSEYSGTKGSSLLGKGCFGMVKRYKHIKTGNVIAVKIVDKQFLRDHDMLEQMNREISIHSTLKHPNIVTYIGHQETSRSFYLGMEYANGGNLFKKLKDNQKFSARRSAYYLQQVLQALVKLHRLGLIHRDLKPENLLLFSTDDKDIIKLSDFGWSNEALVRKSMANLTKNGNSTDAPRNTFCGTKEYISPEMMMSQPHSFPIDIWAVGVLAYEMLVGKAPFEGSTVFQQILEGTIKFPNGLDPDAISFIKTLMSYDPAKRPTASQALRHRFITKHLNAYDSVIKPGTKAMSSLEPPNHKSGAADYHTKRDTPPSAPLISRQMDHPSIPVSQTESVSSRIEELADANREIATLKAEALYSRKKVHQLKELLQDEQDHVMEVENQINEHKASSDRVMMQIGPLLRTCLKDVGVSPQQRSNEGDDVLALAVSLSNAIRQLQQERERQDRERQDQKRQRERIERERQDRDRPHQRLNSTRHQDRPLGPRSDTEGRGNTQSRYNTPSLQTSRLNTGGLGNYQGSSSGQRRGFESQGGSARRAEGDLSTEGGSGSRTTGRSRRKRRLGSTPLKNSPLNSPRAFYSGTNNYQGGINNTYIDNKGLSGHARSKSTRDNKGSHNVLAGQVVTTQGVVPTGSGSGYRSGTSDLTYSKERRGPSGSGYRSGTSSNLLSYSYSDLGYSYSDVSAYSC